ncbi:MAG: globin domain-containing protein [Dermatophilaceae bacterium]
MDTNRLTTTWHAVTQHGDDVASFFYAHLFVSHPELRALFPLTMDVQRDRLVSALGRVVSSVENLGEVVPFVEQLGRDHRRFSVIAEHYDAVGASLLWTLQHFLGPSWTDDVARDWAAAYGVVSSTMVAAAEGSEHTQPPWWDAEVVQFTRASASIAVFTVRPSERLTYRAGQSVAVSSEHVPRVWRYLSPANAPRPDDTIEFHLSVVPGGQFSGPVARRLAVGDVVRLGAPVGTHLVLDDANDTDLLMVAGTTGISPFLAHLEEIAQAHREGRSTRRVSLVHGARFAWDLYAGKQLAELRTLPWLTAIEAVSEDPTFPGFRGTAGAAAATAATSMGATYDALVCGSPGMVHDTITRLEALTAAPQTIRFEEYQARPHTTASAPTFAHTGGAHP